MAWPFSAPSSSSRVCSPHLFTITTSILIVSVYLRALETTSAPQFSGNIGNFQNSSGSSPSIGGGAHPAGEMNNRTGSYPGSGYPGSYYETHGNDSLPTSPSAPEMNGNGGMDLANSTVPSACDSDPIDNVNNPTAPAAVPNNPAQGAQSGGEEAASAGQQAGQEAAGN